MHLLTYHCRRRNRRDVEDHDDMMRIIKDYAIMIAAFVVFLGLFGGGALYLQHINAPEPIPALASTPIPTGRAEMLVDASWLAAQRENGESRVVVIDVSNPEHYALEHIPGAIHIAWQDTMNLNGAGYGEATGLASGIMHTPDLGATQDDVIVVYDNNASKHASRLVWQLRTSGYANAVVLDGGLAAWKGAGFPTSTTESTPAAVASPTDTWIANNEITIEQLADWSDDPNLVIIDTRSEEQKRDTINDTVRMGKIPGALSLPSAAVMREDGTFASPEELEAIFAPLNLSPGNVIVVYGRFGTETGRVWLAFRLAGFEDVRVLDDGWIAWGYNEDLPIDPVATP